VRFFGSLPNVPSRIGGSGTCCSDAAEPCSPSSGGVAGSAGFGTISETPPSRSIQSFVQLIIRTTCATTTPNLGQTVVGSER
jgi:hypothetical protein